MDPGRNPTRDAHSVTPASDFTVGLRAKFPAGGVAPLTEQMVTSSPVRLVDSPSDVSIAARGSVVHTTCVETG